MGSLLVSGQPDTQAELTNRCRSRPIILRNHDGILHTPNADLLNGQISMIN
jgi:hypothetical protein